MAGAELPGHHIDSDALGLHSGAEALGHHIRAGGASVVQGLDREDRGA